MYVAFIHKGGDGNFFLKLLGSLKILRLSRINGVIVDMNAGKETKAVYKVLYLIFMMFMYIHISACIWNLTIEEQEVYIPNMDFIWYGSA